MPNPVLPGESSLWEFSLALYARPDVAAACLRLQDEHLLNVNLLLWCVWLEGLGLKLELAQLHTAQRHIRGWDQHYVVPLRHLRQRMKAEFGTGNQAIEQVRSYIKQAELAAEQQLQLKLELLASGWLQNAGATAAGARVEGDFKGDNLRLYLQDAGVSSGAIQPLIQCVAGALCSISSS